MGTSKEWKWGYINREGEMEISPRFDGAGDFHEGLAAVKVDWARGYIDKSGAWVIEPQYQKAGDFRDGVAEVELDGEKYYIDREGARAAGPRHATTESEAASLSGEGFAQDAALLSGDGPEPEGSYFETGPYSEGLARVQKTASGKWGYVNEEGRRVIKAQYRQAGDFHEGLARVLVQTET